MKIIITLLWLWLCCGIFEIQSVAGEAILSRTVTGMQPITGYSAGGAGFAFSPNVDIVVTSLGCGAVQLTNEAVEVVLWDSNGQRLVSAQVTTNSPVYNGSYYEWSRPALLVSNQTYYVSSCGTTSGVWVGLVIDATLHDGTFEVAPELTYIGMASATNSDGTYPVKVISGANLPSGANFQFVRAPLIVVGGLRLGPSQVQLDVAVTARGPPSFTLLQAQQPTGPWVTNLQAVVLTNVESSSYSLQAPVQGEACFYRVQSP